MIAGFRRSAGERRVRLLLGGTVFLAVVNRWNLLGQRHGRVDLLGDSETALALGQRQALGELGEKILLIDAIALIINPLFKR